MSTLTTTKPKFEALGESLAADGGFITLKRAVHRLVPLVSLVLLAFAGAVVLPTAPRATAQTASPVATAQHPIVGAWWWENISDDPFDDSYAVFGDDGTYVEETTYIGAGI